MMAKALFSLMLTIVCYAPSYGSELIFGYPDFAPHISWDKSKKKIVGTLAPVAKEAINSLNHPTKMVLLPIMRYKKSLGSGETDIALGNAQIDGMRECCYIGKVKLETAVVSFYSHDNIEEIKPLFLRNKTIAAMKFYNYLGLRKRLSNPTLGNKFVNVSSNQQGLALLKGKRADLFLAYGTEVTGLLNTDGLKEHVQMESPVYFVVSKKTTNGRKVWKQLDATAQKFISQTKD